VVLGGSNWTTRASIRRDADAFAALGLAALVYDARGVGESTGDSVCSFEDSAADARAAVDALAARPDVDPKRIRPFGRSRGGWIAPLAASRRRDVAFLVLAVPPAISPEKQETTRRLGEFRAAGHGEAEQREAREYLDLLWKAIDSQEAWDRYAALRD